MADQRLFFALWPDSKVRGQLARLLEQVLPQGGRSQHPQDLHITLVFLGQVDNSQRSCAEEVAEKLVIPSFSLQLDKIGYWPRPRILWCGPSVCPESLQRLVNDLQSGLKVCGFEPERRRYQPHITLLRKARRPDSMAVESPIEWQASEFVLATSGGQDRNISRYQILRRWTLGPVGDKGSEPN